MQSDEAVNYCPTCGKYFDDVSELEKHKEQTLHGTKQNTLFEQLTPLYQDHQNIMIEDQAFSLPPPRKHVDKNEAKANWEGLWNQDRIKVLQDAMLDTEYAEYSFKDLPEFAQDKIYYTLQKIATTREKNEQNITDDGVSPIETEDQFDDWEELKEFDPSVLPLASIGVDVAKSLEPFVRLKIKQYMKEAIPLDCPQCQKFRGRPHELYLHLRDQGFDNADATRITNKQLNDWKEIEIQKLQQNKSADQLKQKKGLLSSFFEAKEYIQQWSTIDQFVSELTPERLDLLDYYELKEIITKIKRTMEFIKDSMDEPEHYGVVNDDEKARSVLLEMATAVQLIENKMLVIKSQQDYQSNADYIWDSLKESQLLKSDTEGPYELSNRNGSLISQYLETEQDVQNAIDSYQSEYESEHYGSYDALVVLDSIGNDVSRMFNNAVQQWETVSEENIDKQLDYMLGDDNE